MKSWKKPTPEQVSKAVASIGRVEQNRYFFDRLENPTWINPLKEKGFFQNPPQAIRDDAKGTISFPPWPESRYLARMASFAPEVVMEIALKIKTDNARVHEDLVDAALSMPAEISAKIVLKAIIWIKSPYQLLLPSKLGSLIQHFVKGGQPKAAIKLSSSLLAVFSNQRSTNSINTKQRALRSDQPQAHMDPWEYGEILKQHIPVLVEVAGKPVLQLLVKILEDAIRFSSLHNEENSVEDYSYIWRPAIEDHVQNSFPGVREMLVSAVRDATLQIATAENNQIPDLVHMLEARRYRVFHRIALHLLRCFPGTTRALITERLLNKDNFYAPGLRHEYFLLEQDQFTHLTKDQQKTILEWINAGPEPEYLHALGNTKDPSQSEEEITKYIEHWKLLRLEPIKEFLPSKLAKRYTSLVAKYGVPEHPEFLSYTSGVQWGPTSPKSSDDLQGMSVDEIIAFLNAWRPSKEFMAPSPEGFGRVITTLVTSEPSRFAVDAEKFENLEPTYVRAMITGLRDAAKKNIPFEWPSVLRLCLWVVKQPRDSSDDISGFDRDYGWGWTRKAIAELLGSGFELSTNDIPFNLRVTTWEILQPLTYDPEPTPEYEERFGGTNMDPATLSINTVRGEAIHTVFRYALWIRRNHEHLINGQEYIERGFAEMPEVREVLEDHLDLNEETSLAVRAVYGQWFPWLILLDKKWSKESVTNIFPGDKTLQQLHDAAWNTYLFYCSPYDNVLPFLYEEYSRAIEKTATKENGKNRLTGDPSEHLAVHLATFYWRGKLDLDDPNGLLSQFYKTATDNLRGHLNSFIGRSLSQTEDKIPPKILNRFTKLWKHRMEIIRKVEDKDDYKQELSAFGWWFASGKFKGVWSITQLKEVLLLVGYVEMDNLVIEKLVDLAPSMPLQSMECLNVMIKNSKDEWIAHRCREPAFNVLKVVLQSYNQTAKQLAYELIDYYGSRFGDLSFRSLIS